MNSLVEVAEFAYHYEAEFAQDILKTNGIPSAIRCDDCGSMVPNLSYVRGVKILVDEKDAETALALLQASMPENEHPEHEEPPSA